MRNYIALCLLLAFTSLAGAQEFGETVRIVQPFEDDLYAAGRFVELRAPVNGDAVIAGQTIGIHAPVAQDVIAAGEIVNIDAPIGDDLRAVGRSVRMNADVKGHVIAAGELVVIARDTQIGSYAWLAGENIVIDGEIGTGLKAAGESVRITGHISGNAEVTGARLELLPGARIDGNLIWRGREKPRIDQKAQIGGELIQRPLPADEHRGAKMVAWMGFLFILAFVITGVVLYLLFPKVAHQGALAVRKLPGLSALLGFVLLMLTPLAIFFLFLTGVGGILAAILLAIYIVAIPVGALMGTFTLTDLLLAKTHTVEAGRVLRTGAFALAIALVGVLQMVPLLGLLLTLWLMLWGLGAIGLLLYRSTGDGKNGRGAETA